MLLTTADHQSNSARNVICSSAVLFINLRPPLLDMSCLSAPAYRISIVPFIHFLIGNKRTNSCYSPYG